MPLITQYSACIDYPVHAPRHPSVLDCGRCRRGHRRDGKLGTEELNLRLLSDRSLQRPLSHRLRHPHLWCGCAGWAWGRQVALRDLIRPEPILDPIFILLSLGTSAISSRAAEAVKPSAVRRGPDKNGDHFMYAFSPGGMPKVATVSNDFRAAGLQGWSVDPGRTWGPYRSQYHRTRK